MLLNTVSRAECTVTHIHSLHRPDLYEWTLLIRSLETVLLSRFLPPRAAPGAPLPLVAAARRRRCRSPLVAGHGSLARRADPVGYLLNIPEARRDACSNRTLR